MPTVTCSNCGKRVPYEGNVCPYCHADKAADKDKFHRTFSFTGAVFFGALFGGFIGYGVSQGSGCCIGVIIGPIVGFGICYTFLSLKGP
jgi:hypothetical protein